MFTTRCVCIVRTMPLLSACIFGTWYVLSFKYSQKLLIWFMSIRLSVCPSHASIVPKWNLFQNNLREPDMQIDCFRRTLKTCLFDQYLAH